MRLLWIALAFSVPLQAQAFCFQEAGQRYQVDPLLLEAIAIWESNLRPGAVNHNLDANGIELSADYGVMQINTANVNRLMKMGLIKKPQDLLADPCFNVQAGAWVLAQHLRVCGNTWRCLGSYNAGFSTAAAQETKRLNYSQQIRTVYNRLKALGAKPASIAIR